MPALAAQFVPRTLPSAALGCRVSYGAYVPEQVPEHKLPLLFFLHGAYASHQDLRSHAEAELLRLAATNKLIIITPEGSKHGWYVDSPHQPQHQYQAHLLSEVLPDARAWLPADKRQSIAGISAGGNAALVCALTHPDLFLSVSSMSGALDLERAKERPALRHALGNYDADPALWQRFSARHVLQRHAEAGRHIPSLLSVGSSDVWAETNRAVAAEWQAIGGRCELQESPGAHDWTYWVSQLHEHIAFHARYLNAPQ